MSIQDIRPNPQDTSNFYLANIYRTISDPNQSNISLPSPPTFSPPTYAVWVNSLWFLSLVISLTCALLATLLQQWARRFLKVNQPRYSPHKRARIRAFFAEGVDKFLLPWTVEALPTLLHVSLFLFFAGLVVFLCNVNLTAFKLVLSWVSICTALYGCITFIPIFHHDSPYYTPLSFLAWHIVTGIPFLTFRALRRLTYLDYFSGEAYGRFQSLEESYRKLLVQGIQKTAEETALNSPSEIDTRAFLWTFDSLDEDHELERFFFGLPGFRSSKVVNDPLPSLTEEQKWKLLNALIGLSDRTFSSNLLPEPDKSRRAVICARAIDPTDIPFLQVLDRIVSEDQYGPVQSTGIARLVRGWGNSKGVDNPMVISAIVSSVVARAQRRDDHWFAIASDELGVPETVLRDYAEHGDSLSLAILIHITRLQFDHFLEPWPREAFSNVLNAASKFNVQDTSPELQYEFCALWNRIVLHVQDGNAGWTAFRTLGPIRNVYVALHQDTDSAPTQFSASTSDQDWVLSDPTSYPVCNIPGHIHDDPTSTTFPLTVLYDNAALAPASLASPNASSSVPAPLYVVNSLMDVLPLDNFHCDSAHQTTIESVHFPVALPDPATATPIRDIVTSGRTIPQLTPETPTPASLSPTSPPAADALQLNPNILIPSSPPNLPSSNPVLDNILPTGSPLPSPSTMTQSDLSPSFPESHRSTIVTSAPCASPGPISAPDLGAATEDDGSPKPGLGKEKDALALDPPSVNRAAQSERTLWPP